MLHPVPVELILRVVWFSDRRLARSAEVGVFDGSHDSFFGVVKDPLSRIARRLDIVGSRRSEYPFAVLAWSGNEFFERQLVSVTPAWKEAPESILRDNDLLHNQREYARDVRPVLEMSMASQVARPLMPSCSSDYLGQRLGF